ADLSVTGRLLSVGGAPRATGLGVHANARLVFVLPPGAASLRVTGGLADEVGELAADASVRFEVRIDGEVAARSGVLREGQEPVVLRVGGLDGGERLELLVDDGGDDDAGDRAAWVDGVILLDDA
ncbi:MAG TPA: NPCBM/NEW2 domain-containing protein, partial [Planctomycetota bacterium]|nr:NPCBM/NEW2 domain-containing protein [Planctomycetota bacterium]